MQIKKETPIQPAIENTRIHSHKGVPEGRIYDTCSEHTIEIMKKVIFSFNYTKNLNALYRGRDHNPILQQAVWIKLPDSNSLPNDDLLTFEHILKTVVCNNNKPRGGVTKLKRFENFKKIFPIGIGNIEAGIEDECEDLLDQGMKKINPSDIFEVWTGLETLLGLTLSENTDTLPDISNLTYDISKKDEKQNEKNYRIALENFFSN